MVYDGKAQWLARRGNMPTDAGSDELARLAPAIRAHSFFSARVANGHVLDKLREISDSYTRGETDIATARLRLKQWLNRNGAGKIEVANLWSTARLNLILKQNARMAMLPEGLRIDDEPGKREAPKNCGNGFGFEFPDDYEDAREVAKRMAEQEID